MVNNDGLITYIKKPLKEKDWKEQIKQDSFNIQTKYTSSLVEKIYGILVS